MTDSKREVPITIEMLAETLAKGRPATRILDGPDRAAHIVDVRWDGRTLTLVYDRDVPQPLLQAVDAIEVLVWAEGEDEPDEGPEVDRPLRA